MKILIITPSPPEYLGGLALFSKDLCINLEKHDIEVDMLTSTLSKKGPIFERIGNNTNVVKLKTYGFSDNDNILKVKNPLFFIFKHLRKYAKNYDIIHVHSYIYFSTIQAFVYKLIFNRKIPMILHLHGGVQTEQYKTSTIMEKVLLFLKKYMFDFFTGKLILKKANALISVSKDDILATNRVFKISRKKNNFYLPNVVDSNKFRKLEKVKKKYIGFIGRLTKIKGIDLFLKIIELINKKDKSQEFLIIGEGPYIYEVKQAVKKYPIKFIENIAHNEIVKFYNDCSIFMQTSRAEGLPTCILEALSCEVPVVASNVGGTNEIVHNGKTGYLFENGNVNEAIEAIDNIKRNNLFYELGKNGRELIKNKFSWEVITGKIVLIYKKVLREYN